MGVEADSPPWRACAPAAAPGSRWWRRSRRRRRRRPLRPPPAPAASVARPSALGARGVPLPATLLALELVLELLRPTSRAHTRCHSSRTPRAGLSALDGVARSILARARAGTRNTATRHPMNASTATRLAYFAAPASGAGRPACVSRGRRRIRGRQVPATESRMPALRPAGGRAASGTEPSAAAELEPPGCHAVAHYDWIDDSHWLPPCVARKRGNRRARL